MNFPRSAVGKMASPVCFLIFERMTHIEKCSANNGDDQRGAATFNSLAELV